MHNKIFFKTSVAELINLGIVIIDCLFAKARLFAKTLVFI